MGSAYTRGYCDGHADALSGRPHKFRVTQRSVADLQAAEVDWYKKHGRYPKERICKDGHGNEYVAGDQSWRGPYEVIEPSMRVAIGGIATHSEQDRGGADV